MNEVTLTVPFPHTIIDGLLPDWMINGAVTAFPDEHDPRWHTFDEPHERGKQQMDDETAWNLPPVSELLDWLGRTWMVDRIETLTGIEGLVPKMTGGGMHQTLTGGYLGMHTDSTSDFDDAGLYRRVNALLFLNIAWRTKYGGELHLDAGPGSPPSIIAPQANRLVVFETTPHTWHGHPKPWAGIYPRRSLAMYYYTQEPPPDFAGHVETYFRGD